MQALTSLVLRGLLVPFLATAPARAVCAEDIPPPPPLRALVVTIVAQDGFLDGLLAAAVRAGRIPPLELSTAHVREIPRRLAAEDFDLVIAHDHAGPPRRLAERGLLADGRVVFANPLAVIGPADDPAGVAGAPSLATAMARVADAGRCWVIEQQPRLAALQRPLLAGPAAPACIVDQAGARGAAAVSLAHARGGYSVWGLHPFDRARPAGQRAFVIDEARLLSPLRAWRVTASARGEAVMAVLAELGAPATQARLADFRLEGDADNQAWWPAPASDR